MSKRLLTTVICMACALLAVADATDAQLREILHRAVCNIDDPHGGPGEVRYAIRLSGDNTNRVVSYGQRVKNSFSPLTRGRMNF